MVRLSNGIHELWEQFFLSVGQGRIKAKICCEDKERAEAATKVGGK